MVGVPRGQSACATITHIVPLEHSQNSFPRSQGELVRRARGTRTQKQFSQILGVERSCLSRYESEKLGAPTKVLNHCLSAIAAQIGGEPTDVTGLAQALIHARQAVFCLESVKAASDAQASAGR